MKSNFSSSVSLPVDFPGNGLHSKVGIRLLFILGFFGFIAAASQAQVCCSGPNLCTNPSFETDDHVPSNFNTTFQGTPAAHNAAGWSYGESISFPANWDYMDGNGYYLNGGDAQDGTRFVYTRGDGQCVNYAFNKSSSCKLYQVCFYAAAFSPSGSQNSADFGIHYRTFSGANLSGSQVLAEPVIEFTAPASTSWANLNWQQYSVIIFAPANALSLVVHFSSAEGTDGICFDNICITDITADNSFASNNNPACGGALTLYGLTQGNYTWPGAPQITYSWIGPNGFASTQQSPTVSNSAAASHNGTYTLTITAGPSGNTCQFTASTAVNVSCGTPCSLSSAGKILEICNDNGTAGSSADDYITFSLNPTGSGLGASYSVAVNNGGTLTNLTNGLLTGISYGSAMSFRLQNGSANGTLYTITITDVSGAPCTATTTVQQNPCSTILCSLTSAGESGEACNDNGTAASSADDYITFSLNPTGSGLGASYSVAVNNGGTLTNLTNGLLTGISYGSAMSFRLQNGSANSTLYTITVTDASGAPCTAITTVQQSCASTGACSCQEYIYLNEPAENTILKFRVNSGVPVTEVTGANGAGHWYPGAGPNEMTLPHGLGTDLNGNLYIASLTPNATIRQFDCDGQISPVADFSLNLTHALTNMFSIGSTLYLNHWYGDKQIAAYDLCTGALLGEVCLNTANGIPMPNTSIIWGLSYNPVTETVYAAHRYDAVPLSPTSFVYAFSRAQLEAAVAANGSICIDPLISSGPSSTLNPGDHFTPAGVGLGGIVGDNNGNIYVVVNSNNAGGEAYVAKYSSSGHFISKSPTSSGPGGKYNFAYGIVWSESTNRLYASNYTDDPTSDCISVFNATNMNYLGTGVPNPGTPATSNGKAIAILKECCPVSLEPSFTKNVCGSTGAKFYLNEEAFSTCDGVVCGSSWTPTSLTGMTFDPCDNSVTITGTGCGTFTFNTGAITSTGCSAQASTFTICNTAPSIINPSAPQTFCEAGSGADISVQTNQNIAGSIRFVRFTSDQMAGATPSAAEAQAIYSGATVGTAVTPTGGSSPYTATLTSSIAGWNSLTPGTYYVYAILNPDQGGSCRPVQEIIVTIVDLPVLATTPVSICAGSTVNLLTLVTGNTPTGALTFYPSLAAANAGISPLVNTVVAPAITTTYYVRSQMTSACYSVASITITVNNAPGFNVTSGSICHGGSIDLATLVTNTGGGTLSYHTTLAAAQGGAPALAPATVSPASATYYYVRSVNSSGCFTVKEIALTIKPVVCGAAQVNGPN